MTSEQFCKRGDELWALARRIASGEIMLPAYCDPEDIAMRIGREAAVEWRKAFQAYTRRTTPLPPVLSTGQRTFQFSD